MDLSIDGQKDEDIKWAGPPVALSCSIITF